MLTSTFKTDPVATSTVASNTPVQRSTRLRGLQCLRCGTHYPLVPVHTGCAACASQGIHVSLRASYSLQTDTSQVPWHCLPYTAGVSLGEGNTPLVASPALAQAVGVATLHIKDESSNPTGSHKDRMSAIGITQALDCGARTVVLASSGNAAVSAARYAAAAGLTCEVATYDGMSAAYATRLDGDGAQRFTFTDNAGRWAFVAQRAQQPGYFALTNYHLPALGSAPLAIEGYKAIAYECHASGCVPGHIMVPTARGDLAWGIYAGFADLLAAGQIVSLPKIWVVEPFARLSHVLGGAGLHNSYPGRTAQFSTAGATVTYLQWQAVTASGGGAVVVVDAAARQARQLLAKQGYSAELCAAAGLAGAQQLLQQKKIAAHEQVLLILTANASHDPSWPDPL